MNRSQKKYIPLQEATHVASPSHEYILWTTARASPASRPKRSARSGKERNPPKFSVMSQTPTPPNLRTSELPFVIKIREIQVFSLQQNRPNSERVFRTFWCIDLANVLDALLVLVTCVFDSDSLFEHPNLFSKQIRHLCVCQGLANLVHCEIYCEFWIFCLFLCVGRTHAISSIAWSTRACLAATFSLWTYFI